MPLCGFDKKMLDGLEMFYDGLIDAVERKTKLKGIRLEEVVAKEINDMHAFLRELEKLENPNDRQALIGVTNLAQALYIGAANHSQKGVLHPSLELTLPDTKARYKKLFEETDRKYEEECKDKANPMSYLVDLINKFKDKRW